MGAGEIKDAGQNGIESKVWSRFFYLFILSSVLSVFMDKISKPVVVCLSPEETSEDQSDPGTS